MTYTIFNLRTPGMTSVQTISDSPVQTRVHTYSLVGIHDWVVQIEGFPEAWECEFGGY